MRLFQKKSKIKEFSIDNNIDLYERSLNTLKECRDGLPKVSKNFDLCIEELEKSVENYKKMHGRI